MTTLPESLKTEFSRWASHGARPQQEFTWRPRSWKDGFGKRALDLPGVNLLEAVETIAKAAGSFTEDRSATIDREMVKNLHDPEVLHPNGSTEPQAVVTAFIASMIWGYGTTGYGHIALPGCSAPIPPQFRIWLRSHALPRTATRAVTQPSARSGRADATIATI